MQLDRPGGPATFRSEYRTHVVVGCVIFGVLLLPSVGGGGLNIWERRFFALADVVYVAMGVWAVRSTIVTIDGGDLTLGGLRTRHISRSSIVCASERPENWIWPGRRVPVLTLQSGELVTLHHFPIRSAKDAGARLVELLQQSE